MVNATEMAKIFAKKVENFTRMDSTKSFIEECLKNANSRFLMVEKEEDLINSKQKSGTWMHKILALKFAAWLDPAFELWVYITIDTLINKHVKELRDSMVTQIALREQKEAKKKELLLKHPEMADYFELEELENRAKNRRTKQIMSQMKQLKLELSFDNEPA